MNYLSIYNLIVSNAKSTDRRKRKHTDEKYVYYEKHHIIPKCVGGTDVIQNLVLLTAREHFVVHQLLTKIYPNEHKLVFALRRMCSNNNTKHKRNNKEYEWIRKRIAKESSLMQKGKSGKGYKFPKGHTLSQGSDNGMSGKSHSTDTKESMSILAIARGSDHLKNIPKTDLHKENMRKSKQIKKYKLISPDGTEYIFNRAQDASKFSGVSTAVIIKLAGNRYGFNHCRNWQCISVPI
jgi:hypothetical protein